MRTFEKYLVEMPLAPDLISKLESNDSMDFVRQLEAYAKKVKSPYPFVSSHGFFRHVVSMPVLGKLFSVKQLNALGYKKSPKQIPTVIKVAGENSNMNKSEWDKWKRWGNKKEGRWLCPIIDRSDDILHKLKPSYFFIQMPLCNVKRSDVRKKLIETFGDVRDRNTGKSAWDGNEDLDPAWTVFFYEMMEFKGANPNLEWSDAYKTRFDCSKQSKEQETNLTAFIKTMEAIDVWDIKYGNIGIYEDRLVIIDYATTA